MKLLSITEIRELNADDLAARLKRAVGSVASAHILTGKLVFVMDEQRPEKGTLKAYVRAQTGMEIETHAYKCANAFSLVGEGYGTCTEADYDACKLRWLITVSQILNVLADDKDESFVAKTREAVAAVLRERKDDAGKMLEAIYKAIKPSADKGGDGDGAGDADADDQTENVASLTATPFSKEWYKEILHALSALDVDALTLARDGFGSLSTIAAGTLEEKAAKVAAIAA